MTVLRQVVHSSCIIMDVSGANALPRSAGGQNVMPSYTVDAGYDPFMTRYTFLLSR